MRAAPLREALFLADHGVPFDVAFRLSPMMRAACCIIVSENSGNGTFNFDTMTFNRPDA